METSTTQDNKITEWFDSFIENLKIDKLMMETGTAPKEKAELYNNIISSNKTSFEKNMFELKHDIDVYFIKSMLSQYFDELKNFTRLPNKFAFQLSNTTISAWAEIDNGDFELYDFLILAEAKVNHLFMDKGFFWDTIITDNKDEIDIPSFYKQISLA